MQLLYIGGMRSATFPPIRVEPEMRASAEAVLRDGESLTEFIESAVRKEVSWRETQAAFVAEARESLAEYLAHGGPTMDEVRAEMKSRAKEGKARIQAAIAARSRAA